MPTLTTIVNPQGSGTIVDSGSGDNHILTPNPSSGYAFKDWLLKGYTQLEYIESDGNQEINTEQIPYMPKIEISATYLSVGSGNNGFLFRCTDSWEVGAFALWSNSTGKFDYQYGNNHSYNIENVSTNFLYNVVCDKGSLTINGVLKSTLSGTPSSTQKIKLLNGFIGRIYYAKIWSYNNFVRYYIPVIRHSDGQIGLLDLVHFKFYGNSGSGYFLAGGIIQ